MLIVVVFLYLFQTLYAYYPNEKIYINLAVGFGLVIFAQQVFCCLLLFCSLLTINKAALIQRDSPDRTQLFVLFTVNVCFMITVLITNIVQSVEFYKENIPKATKLRLDVYTEILNNTLSTIIIGTLIYTYWLYIKSFEDVLKAQQKTFERRQSVEKQASLTVGDDDSDGGNSTEEDIEESFEIDFDDEGMNEDEKLL
jgi:hypothetical protein